MDRLYKNVHNKIMLRLFFFILTFFSVSKSYAELKITWFGTTCVNISDGKTALFFDPFITRPSLWDFVFFKGMDSDQKTLTKWLSKTDSENIKGIFVSHTHYDHVLDLPEMLRRTKAKAYGSLSVQNLVKGAGFKKERGVKIKDGDLYSIGDFEVEVLKGSHPPHFMGYMFMSGQIKNPLKLPASGYSFKKDEDFAFYIKHPRGNILFHPSGNTALSSLKVSSLKADLVLLGIAKRDSTESVLNKVVKPSGAQILIPMHYDNFFKSLNKPMGHLIGVNLKEFESTSAKELSGVQLRKLNFGETFNLKKY
jgi:L-ascorbate metabolism protein UlaG (beta-lactamase superfamily)